jgi:hypothetical protein
LFSLCSYFTLVVVILRGVIEKLHPNDIRGGMPHMRTILIYRVLTYMATVAEAIAGGILVAYELPPWEPRLPIRSLSVRPELLAWADGTPELHDKKLAIGRRTLFEHLLQMFCDFRCSERFHAGDLRRMLPNKKGIWKMHPPGLRIYGWCPQQHAFVAVTGALEKDSKTDKKLNDKKRDEVLAFIKANRLAGTVLMGDILAIFPY